MATIQQYLQDHGVRPSVQRVAIMDYLRKHRTHPTVDDVYTALHGKMPTLSRTTVYNTLELLAERGAVLELTIDGRMAHYDGYTSPHAHFMCRKCGRIYDLPLNSSMEACAQAPQGFKTERMEISYTGVCGQCLQQEQNEDIDNVINNFTNN